MDLTISKLVKLILGIIVVVAVIIGFYFFFKERVLDFFRGVNYSTPERLILYLLK